MARLISVLALVFGLLLGPAFCMAGLVEHACDCEHDQSECNHEDSCATDPCAPAWRGEKEANAASQLATPALPAPGWEATAERTDPAATGRLDPPPRWPRSGIPYAPSDRPLRI